MEIKFVTPFNGKLVRCGINPMDGCLFLIDDNKEVIIPDLKGEAYQFIGLLDHFGSEIYRGDILVTDVFQNRATVIWWQKRAAYACDFGPKFNDSERYQLFNSDYCISSKCRRVGHIGLDQESVCEVV